MLKFMYNGIKTKEGLNKGFISFGNNIYGKEDITVYYNNYKGFDDIVKKEFSIKNDTDSREDYFETDRLKITTENKYFIPALKAFIQSEEKKIKRVQKRINNPKTKEYLIKGMQDDINWTIKKIEKIRKDYL